MLVVTIIGLIANLFSMTILQRGMLGLNVKSAFLHVFGDTLSSFGVVMAAVVIYYTHWYVVDPLTSIIVGVIIVYGAGKMLREVIHILLEGVPRKIRLEEVTQTIMSVPGIEDMHDLHIWSVTSYMHNLTAHLIVKKDALNNLNTILNKVKEKIEQEYGIKHTTF